MYALGSANFLLVNIAIITGLLAHSRRQPNENAIYVAIAGLLLGLLVEVVFLYAAGLVTVRAMRPWKIAYNRLMEKKRAAMSEEERNEKPIGESETATLSTSLYDRPHHGAPRISGPPSFRVSQNGNSFQNHFSQPTSNKEKIDRDDSHMFGTNDSTLDADSIEFLQDFTSSFHKLGIPVDQAMKLERAGLICEEMQDPQLDTMFIDRLLVDAGISVPGHRLSIVRVLKGIDKNFYGGAMDESRVDFDTKETLSS